MAVYVDDQQNVFRNMVMCHMIADSLDELHAMAYRLHLLRAWFQDTNHPHYDLSRSKRAEAIRYGAKEITAREAIEIFEKQHQAKSLEVAVPDFIVGDQIAYIPIHARGSLSHPDVEFGFVEAVKADQLVYLCRYYRKDAQGQTIFGELRTRANGEWTPSYCMVHFHNLPRERIFQMIAEINSETGVVNDTRASI